MSETRMKAIVVCLAVVMVLSVAAPTVVLASQNSHQFNQSWLILGPYYRKNTGSDPGAANIALDYITDGIIKQETYIPRLGDVINTNYALPECGSFSFVWRTRANGFDVPTVFEYNVPVVDGSSVDIRGNTTFINSDGSNSAVDDSVGVFNQGLGYNATTNPQDNQRLNNTVIYAWAWVNNKTGADLTGVRIGANADDRIEVLVDGVV
ncbi:MAG: hypothetical protein N3D11_09600, partial [Candidatus Sumerlaeia bacterium]|nr:hypothetical protein [Candidatus Sumerlaeia bacterium]